MLLLACALTSTSLSLAGTVKPPVAITITLAHGTASEVQTKSQLERLLASYDLRRWYYTSHVIIDEQAIPHSHPTLTLHTRHLKDDDLLLATFLHEELHWYLTQNPAGVESAISDLKVLFPTIPTGYPEGSDDAQGNYVHLIVTWLEFRTTAQVIGELRASQVIAFWATDHYTWIYGNLIARGREIGRVLRQRGLLGPLTGTQG
ncbi:MAG: hypothetical protein ABI679_13445 [Gemmatimonadota bacterium]